MTSDTHWLDDGALEAALKYESSEAYDYLRRLFTRTRETLLGMAACGISFNCHSSTVESYVRAYEWRGVRLERGEHNEMSMRMTDISMRMLRRHEAERTSRAARRALDWIKDNLCAEAAKQTPRLNALARAFRANKAKADAASLHAIMQSTDKVEPEADFAGNPNPKYQKITSRRRLPGSVSH